MQNELPAVGIRKKVLAEEGNEGEGAEADDKKTGTKTIRKETSRASNEE